MKNLVQETAPPVWAALGEQPVSRLRPKVMQPATDFDKNALPTFLSGGPVDIEDLVDEDESEAEQPSQETSASTTFRAPGVPRSLADTGIELPALLDLMTKSLYSGAMDTAAKLAGSMKLPTRLVHALLREAEARQLIETHGLANPQTTTELCYGLTGKGRDWALNALEQNAYIGPVPVPLAEYVAAIRRQSIGTERVPPDAVRAALGNLVMADSLIAQVGPAINSGHSILLYGPPGNGKSSVAECIGRIFNDIIYVPYCFEISGQIVKVFDASIHVEAPADRASSVQPISIIREDFDHRWVACRRPFVITGGELTLEMLDLSFNSLARFYEAPLHVKALNGVFLIDDFGRQIVTPESLLNRWIVPLASRVDYLKLHTGKSFSLPFDELVVFSTNLAPSQLMDPAFLRRIPYKIEVGAPDKDEYHHIFHMVAKKKGVEISDEAVDEIISELTEKNSFPLAAYQPGFIIDQVCAACKYSGNGVVFTSDLIQRALDNLYTKDSPGYGMVR